MLRRTRTTKKLAKRIDLQYFARPHPFRRWRFWLSISIPAIALGWFLSQRAQGGEKVYSSGPLSRAHAVFTQRCSLCHVAQARDFTAHVTDKACLTCHDAPPHHANQTFNPECSSCHVEHKGEAILKATADVSCTQCHAKLRTRDGQPHYVASISGLVGNHPNFTVLRSGAADPGGVRLNHYLHLQPNLTGPDNSRVQMTCGDCHVPSNTRYSPYGAPRIQEAVVAGVSSKRSREHAYLPQPEFARQCAGCHTLQFDKRFGNDQVPHDKPPVVHAFLMKKFGEFIAAHPEAVHEATTPLREIPERERPSRIARNASEWIAFRVDDAEWLLYTKTCKQCHTLIQTSGQLPEVAKSNITARWLAHAEFDHQAHRIMNCTTCHSRAPESRETSDVLLPAIETCQQCHRSQGSAKEAAEGRCFECHEYHDWTKEKPVKGGLTIQQLRGTAALHAPE
jgi:ssDNA-binding Zn-finger/Zn-ribbon topoisomerase 1